jgi:heptosyltransferase-2
MAEHFPKVENVCIRAPNWVGDVVMATPAFRAVRQALPHAHVTVVVRRRVAPILRGAPWFDEEIIYRPEAGRAAGAFLRCVRTLRGRDYGLGLLLPNSFSSALMFRLAGVRRRVGYRRDSRSALLTDAVPRPSEDGRFKPTYMVDYYLSLCKHVGLPAAGRRMELPFGPEDAARADDVLRRCGVEAAERLFLLHPGAGYGPSKRWPNTHFARLAGLLQDAFAARIALIGGPAAKETVEDIRRRSPVPTVSLVSSGIDVHLLKRVVGRSKLLVTTDSGPRHYGVSLGIPTVCVMGPTDPAYSTSSLPHDRVVRLDVDCGPCQLKVCPRDHRCMDEITPEMVFETCCDALAEGGR